MENLYLIVPNEDANRIKCILSVAQICGDDSFITQDLDGYYIFRIVPELITQIRELSFVRELRPYQPTMLLRVVESDIISDV